LSCAACKYGEVLVSKGSPFVVLNPIGDEVTKIHEETVLICRAMPPLGGSFPQVAETDWCGEFKPTKD
jgi:hypothetical protein